MHSERYCDRETTHKTTSDRTIDVVKVPHLVQLVLALARATEVRDSTVLFGQDGCDLGTSVVFGAARLDARFGEPVVRWHWRVGGREGGVKRECESGRKACAGREILTRTEELDGLAEEADQGVFADG